MKIANFLNIILIFVFINLISNAKCEFVSIGNGTSNQINSVLALNDSMISFVSCKTNQQEKSIAVLNLNDGMNSIQMGNNTDDCYYSIARRIFPKNDEIFVGGNGKLVKILNATNVIDMNFYPDGNYNFLI